MVSRYLLSFTLLLIVLAGCSTLGTHRNVNNDEQVQKAVDAARGLIG